MLDIALAAGSRWVEVSAALDNRSTNHWLRMTCPVPGTLRKLQAHTPFDLAERGLQNGAPYVDGNRIRFAQRLGQPMQWGLFASTDQGVLGILNRGLYEYVYEDEAYLSISLMRYVGLIRPDLTSYPAQQANRPGVQRVEYALGFWPQHQITQALRAMVEYNLPPRCVQVFGPPPALPRAAPRWSNPFWMPSAWKPAEEGNGTVLRFWNASDVAQEGVIEYGEGMEGALLARLDETPIGPLPPLIRAGPKEIVTILWPHSGKP
jgi:alpha-mannosidase